MRQSIVSRLGCLEVVRRSRVMVGRSKALADERVRNALAVMTVEDALDGIPSTYEGERARAVIEAAFRADH
jgi:alpha-D-ribose 1-methylphosphonate 5-triphosphate synthase subunit PhnL